jgi:NTE family protein
MDGGVRSATNADLAHRFDHILILNPLGANANYIGAGIDAEVAALEREGNQVLVIAPDAASTTAIGLNPLDPETRQPSALAGRTQGREHAPSVAALWSLP